MVRFSGHPNWPTTPPLNNTMKQWFTPTIRDHPREDQAWMDNKVMSTAHISTHQSSEAVPTMHNDYTMITIDSWGELTVDSGQWRVESGDQKSGDQKRADAQQNSTNSSTPSWYYKQLVLQTKS